LARIFATLGAKAMKPISGAVRKPRTFDEYLARLDADKRAALERIRRAIRAAAPRSIECISYGLAAFRLNGRFFVAIGATNRHCAFYLGSTVRAHRGELGKFDTAKGTIRFQADKPLSTSLVRKLVKARIAENPRFDEGA
jgi:uncharacterized protein YdhG (YjbR/CyaY superfamily)